MRRLILPFLVVLLMFSVTIIGCSDDDDNGGGATGGDTNPQDYDYYFAISKSMFEDKDSQFTAIVQSYQGSPIQSVQLSIDGTAVEMYANPAYEGAWGGLVTLTDDLVSHNFDLTINGTQYEYTLTKSAYPDVEWPDNYVMSQGMEINWTLEPNSNSDIQEIFAYGDNGPNDTEEIMQTIEAHKRSFQIPANWFEESYSDYSFELWEVNYKIKDNLLATSVEIDHQEYDDSKKQTEPLKRLREIVNQIRFE